jgi:hypothetical protein
MTKYFYVLQHNNTLSVKLQVFDIFPNLGNEFEVLDISNFELWQPALAYTIHFSRSTKLEIDL